MNSEARPWTLPDDGIAEELKSFSNHRRAEEEKNLSSKNNDQVPVGIYGEASSDNSSGSDSLICLRASKSAPLDENATILQDKPQRSRKKDNDDGQGKKNKRRRKASAQQVKNLELQQYTSPIVIHNSVLKILENRYESKPNYSYLRVKEIGNVGSKDSLISSMYITATNSQDFPVEITVDKLADSIKNLISGKVRIQQTMCGLIAAFTKEDDAERVMRLSLAKIFGGPVQAAKFQTGETRYRQAVIVRDIPWCISNMEIYHALRAQGFYPGKVTRTRTNVRIELLNSCDLNRLTQEGMSFFNYASFPVTVENSSAAAYAEPGIIQCYKCQGFWHTSTHCRHPVRCVRCGENHEVEYCSRSRSEAVCCHCAGPHHAAYKLCPVRLQHINCSHVAFTLAKNRPNRLPQHHNFL